ncbi:MAG: HPr family phosphocarrier protein [Blautia sp.]|nr:HPr family phosphocarrier protein [Blautia sp.]
MVSETVRVVNPTGLHLRPAGVLCREALKYRCAVTITFEDSVVNAKSVLSVLGACVKCQDEILLTCDGEDEVEALEDLASQIRSGLGE